MCVWGSGLTWMPGPPGLVLGPLALFWALSHGHHHLLTPIMTCMAELALLPTPPLIIDYWRAGNCLCAG